MPRIAKELQAVVRQRLVDAAAKHFARSGLDRARIDDISRDAGFAKGTVYNYFASKEELFGAVIEQGARRAVERFELDDSQSSVRARLLSLAQADVSVLREQEDFVKVLVREAMSFRPDTYPLIEAHLAPYLAAVASVLTEGARARSVRTDVTVEQLAMLFVGTLSLLYVQYWGSGGAWPSLDQIPELAVTSFLEGASPRPNRPGR